MRAFVMTGLLTATLFVSQGFSEPKVSLSGTVKDNSGKPIDNAVVRLESLGYVSITDAQGYFKIDNTSPVLPKDMKQGGVPVPRIKNDIVYFSVEKPQRLLLKVYSLQGRLCNSIDAGEVGCGFYSVNLHSLFTSNIGNGTFVVHGLIGTQRFSAPITKISSRQTPFTVRSLGSVSTLKKNAQSGSVDRLIITKLGMAQMIIDITSYEKDMGTVEVTPTFDLTQSQIADHVEDSLMQLLIKRIEKIDSIDGPDDLKTIDYISIRSSFEVLLAIDSTRFKSNVGYMVSSILSLNTSRKIWNLVDSIQDYINEVEDFYDESPAEPELGNGLLKRSLKKGGVISLGKVLAAQTPEILTSVTKEPSFPRFLTLSYIQGTIESELLPVLNRVIAVSSRIEGLKTDGIKINVDDESYELDKGEVYLFDAYAHLLRAYMLMYCTYNMDIYSSPSDLSYSWIDSIMINGKANDNTTIYSLRSDTLFQVHSYDDSKVFTKMFKTFKYNLEERPEFMTIRKQNHEGILSDLRAVPTKVKAGLASIRSETDDQDDDLLKISMIDSANGDMLDFSNDLIDDGMSESFAANFSSVEKMTDFISSLLSGPYTFDEMVDGKQVTITVNLSAFFTNPVTDLRTLLPKYKWVDEINWVTLDVSQSDVAGRYWGNVPVWNAQTGKYDTLYCVTVYEDEQLKMDESLIDSVVKTSYYSKYYISKPIRYTAYIDSNYTIEPIRLTNDEGTPYTYDQIEDLVENMEFLPYFKDYTFNGLFPGMTRQKWLDLIYQTE